MSCEKLTQIHAYHDGVLPANERDAVESHLTQCAECKGLLEDLQRLSLMFANVPFAGMTDRARSRMIGAWWASQQQRDRGVRQLAGWMTAAAAAVLVFVPLFSDSAPVGETVASNNNTFVDSIAFIAPAGPRDESSSDLVQVAQWLANDLSLDQGQ